MGLFDFFKKNKEGKCCGGCCCHNNADNEDSGYYEELYEMGIDPVNDYTMLPRYAHYGDAGLDVCAASFKKYFDADNTVHDVEGVSEFVLHPRQRLLIGTGIKADIPKPIFFFATIRSGLSTKHGIMLVNGPGVIDNIYKGEICLPVINMSDADFKFKIGDRIGQLIPIKQIFIASSYAENGVGESERGEGGFGHTGGFGG